MTTDQRPIEIVLAGGGHAHVFVLKAFGLKPEPGVRLTVVAKELSAPYSGMLPGFVAGHYALDACHIDLRQLAKFAGAKLIHGEVTGIDVSAKQVMIKGQPALTYDLVSVGVGITPDLRDINGATEHALAVKPVSVFAPKWQALEARALSASGPRSIPVIGGGAAGVELILAARYRLRSQAPSNGIDPGAFSFYLISGGDILPSHNARAQVLARNALAEAGIEFVQNRAATAVTESHVHLDDGRKIKADAVLISTKAVAPSWFATTNLARDVSGFLALRPTLQVIGNDHVFAGGDCGTVIDYPRPKAGVFAVRQGPVLAENLRRVATGAAARSFTPQSQFLTLVSLGAKDAIAARGSFAMQGAWAWWLKDRIDRGFVDGFNGLRKP